MKDKDILDILINSKDRLTECEIKAIENLIVRNKKLKKYKKYYENEKVIWHRKDYIPKSKVKEKIKERKEIIELERNISKYYKLIYEIEALQELLED